MLPTLLLDGIQFGDAAQRLRRDGTLVGGMQVEKFASEVRETSQFLDALGKQTFVAAIVVHHQGALPALQEVFGMLPTAVCLVIEYHQGVALFQVIAAVGPQIGAVSLAPSR